MLQRGDIAPDFDLPCLVAGVRQRFLLADYRGKQNLVLAFYPSNWEPVSTEQMVAFQVEREKFRARNTEVVGICVDSIMNTTAWEREIGPLEYPMCSDFWPHADVSFRYGVLRDEEPFRGASEHAIFIINKSGIIEFNGIYSVAEVAAAADVLDLLGRLSSAA
jgi:alkyl hydroperoxide reductase subunit AhpC